MEKLDIHSTSEDYFERFEIWAMTKEADEDVNIVSHCFTFIGKEAYSLLKTLAMPEKPISLPYTTLKELLLDYVKYTTLECGKGRSRKMIHEDIKNSTTLLRHPNPVNTQGYADNSLSLEAVHEDGHKFGQCLSCGRFHSFNSCKFRNSKCFKCRDIGQVQSVCNANVHLTVTNITSCNFDSIESSFHDDHLSLSTISKDSAESYGCSELNKIQNSCETIVSNQSIYQISHVIVPDMVFPNDSYISDEISYKSEENMLCKHNYDQKSDIVLIDADFSNDPLLCNDILNKFHEDISEESFPNVISYITYLHNAFDPCEKLFQCDAQVLNDLDFNYNLDDSISTAVYSYHKNTSNVYSNQCEKYVLNEVTSFIICGYKDPTLFRGGG
ncbi:unnamed protein product [Schistosoma curassoni]|uniref:DUF4806 domain-containing protein n=1 Tax=Schistosoma curassoni TaxID=6186 RepID=A0A183KY35_9TREM|nr:unnamed protein product [Schistosoma curassoni]